MAETPATEEVLFRSPSQAAGFTQANNLILLDTVLSDGAKVTYLLLLMYAWQGANAFPGQERMAGERGTSDRTIRNHITEIEARGLITVERRGKKLTNRYWIEPLDAVYRSADVHPKRKVKTAPVESDIVGANGCAISQSDRKISSTHVIGKKLPVSDRKKISSPREEDPGIEKYSGKALNVSRSRETATNQTQESAKSRPTTLNENGSDGYLKLILGPVQLVESLTGDIQSRARYVQLREICLEHRRLAAWDVAYRSTERRMKRPGAELLRRPGAWFDRALVRELDKYGVQVPTSADKQEGEAVRGLIGASLGLPK